MHNVMHNLAPLDATTAPATAAHVPVMALDRRAQELRPGAGAQGRRCAASMPGEVHAIVGENGAGKSTLIGIAAGVLQADRRRHLLQRQACRRAGSAPHARETASRWSISTRRSFAGSHGARKSAARGAGARRSGRSRSKRSASWHAWLPTNCACRVNKRVGELSLAQRHIVEIARALATQPEGALPRRADRAASAGRRAQTVRSDRRAPA